MRRDVKAEDIGYVLSTTTVPEFLTGREFLKFFMDINESYIKDPKPLDAYFDYMSIDPEDRDKLLKDLKRWQNYDFFHAYHGFSLRFMR